MISEKQKTELGNDIAKFLAWLRGKLNSNSTKKYNYIDFSEPDEGDWFMEVPSELNAPVKFNTHALNSCTFEYYRMIVIHECFHLLVQDIPNKIDAKRLKDDFGDPVMVFLDIEADYYTYLYLHEFHSYSLVDIFLLNYEGGSVFGDRYIRFPKFERFISSSLTIVNYYFNQLNSKKEIYLVSIKNLATEDKLHTLVSKATHFEAVNFDVNKQTINELSKCYKRETSNKNEYVSNIIQLCASILELSIPDQISKEIDALHS